jgi:hypothetical protein
MANEDHLSPAQFPAHMAAIKARAIKQRENVGRPDRPERPETLYHGTNAQLKPGDMITAGHESNWKGITHDVKAQHTFATGDSGAAYRFARKAKNNEEDRHLTDGDNGEGPIPSAHVYEVHPTGRIRRDKEVDFEDHAFTPSYQSRQPMRVGKEVSRLAKKTHEEDFG